jgi:hypothetical protein
MNGVQRNQQQGETEEQRAARRALMTAEERISEDAREQTQSHRRDMAALSFQMQETSDKHSYEARATVDAIFRKWQPKVEEELANLRRQGQNVSREQMLYYLIGKAAIEARNSPENRQRRKAAEKRLRQQTTRPSSSRSDAAPTTRRRETSLEKRLENELI